MQYSRFPAAITAAGLSAKVTGTPGENEALPFVHIGEDDENDSFRTQSTNGSMLTPLVHVWSDNPTEAKRIADTIVQDQTDRDNLPSLDVPFKIITVDVESAPTFRDPQTDGPDLYHIPIRFRYQIHTG